MLYVDESTFRSLQIFSTDNHPASNKISPLCYQSGLPLATSQASPPSTACQPPPAHALACTPDQNHISEV